MNPGRSPDAVIEDRRRRLYRRQLDGLSARALVYEHAEKEQVSIPTAWRDWAAIKEWNEEDWQRHRQNLLTLPQHLLTKLFTPAPHKRQMTTT